MVPSSGCDMLQRCELNGLDGTQVRRTFSRMAEPLKVPGAAPGKQLSPAAERALAEAAARRVERDARAAVLTKSAVKEASGPKGPEPTRYGDWERNGLASDF